MTRARQLGITEFPYVEEDTVNKTYYNEYRDGWWIYCEYNEDDKITYYEDCLGEGYYRIFNNDGTYVEMDLKYGKREKLLNKLLNE